MRLNRKRFWGKEMSADKRSAYHTLYTCLMTVAKLIAPFAPFYADQLYMDLGGSKQSVHLEEFPETCASAIDKDLEERMGMAQQITSMVLALRRKVKLMKGIAAQTAALSQEQIAQFEKDGSLPLTVEGQAVEVSLADVEIISEDIPGWLVTNEGNLTVALEVELTEELRREGMARELVNRIQNLRKVTGLEITDRIRVTVQPNENSDAAIAAFGDYIKSQVLADDIVIADNDGQPAEFDGFTLNIKVERK